MMKYFLNNADAKMNDLRNIGIYSKSLLDDLEEGKFDKLEELSEDQKEDIDFMEPLLYAVYDKLKTYIVYKYFGEKLKDFFRSNLNLCTEIIRYESSLIKDTPIAENKELILEFKEANPDIINYISPKLEDDKEFIRELCNTNDREVMRAAINRYSPQKLLEADESLRSNKLFMAAAIQKDISLIEVADKNILNDYDVFKEASKGNNALIDYAIKKNEILGNKALEAVRDTANEIVTKKCIGIIDEKIEEKANGFEFAKSKIEKIEDADPVKIRYLTAVAACKEVVDLGTLKEVLDYSDLSMLRIKRDLDIGVADNLPNVNSLGLVSPIVLNMMFNKLPEQVGNAEIKKRIVEYKAFFDEVQSRRKAQEKAKSNEQIKNDSLINEIRGYNNPSEYTKACQEASEEFDANRLQKSYSKGNARNEPNR